MNVRHFVKYTSSVNWNQAREVCNKEGMELAVINKFSSAFIQHAFASHPQYNNGNIWISIRDWAQRNDSLGSSGFIWFRCKHYHWSNWATGEPQSRGSNWCTHLLYQQNLQWYPEQCLATGPFLCQKMHDNATSDSNCSDSCIQYSGYLVRCWMYTYSSWEGCVLYASTTPLYCNGSSAGSSSGEAKGLNVTLITDVIDGSYDTEYVIVVINDVIIASN
ncbi:hypothetical protein ACOMHN_000994 [Nucella lapillus]